MKRFLRSLVLFFLRPWLWVSGPLNESLLSLNPLEEFSRWYASAWRCFWLEFPDAACLSTSDEAGRPQGRMILLKHFDENGFVFYTNLESRKGRTLSANPCCALTFFWDALQRQVRIEGRVEPVSDAEADAYFASRPRRSQIGAWASEQSRVLESRDAFEQRIRYFREKFSKGSVPRPPYWSGYRVIPDRMEFWKLRANRLHDRFLYTRTAPGVWVRERLYP